MSSKRIEQLEKEINSFLSIKLQVQLNTKLPLQHRLSTMKIIDNACDELSHELYKCRLDSRVQVKE